MFEENAEFATIGLSGVKSAHNSAIFEYLKADNSERDHEKLLSQLDELAISTMSAPTAVSASNAGILYNKAVLYFHRHMHYAALDTLTPICSNAETLNSLEEGIATVVGILMLRLLLATNQFNKAHAYLQMLTTTNVSAFSHLQLDRVSPPNLGKRGDEAHEQELSLKLLAMMVYVQCHKPIAIPEDASVEFAALKAHQYYIMKDFQMAAKHFKKIHDEIPIDYTRTNELRTCIANNMGVIHLRVRHYAIAARFFQDAISFDKVIATNLRNYPVNFMSTAHSCKILYNLGISMLHLRRPKDAFQCLLVPLKTYHSNPRLWFRISEACIMDHEMKALEEEKKMFSAAMTAMNAAGPNCMRQFPPLRPPDKPPSYPTSNPSAAVPEANLEFASLALRNALSLTNSFKKMFQSTNEGDASDGGDADWQNAKDLNFCHPSSRPITKQSFDAMLSAIYAAYSYVSLRLGDYVRALDMAQELLKTEKISDAHKLLGHMYASEALIGMGTDRIAEARPHLELQLEQPLNAFDFETKDWKVKSLDAAQNIIRYNLAVSMVLQGEFNRAKNLLLTCQHPIVAAKSLFLKLYLDLRP